MGKSVDVLFVYTNINGFHSDTYSFGIGYLSGVLKESGFTTALAVVRSRRDYKNVLNAVIEKKPKIIGFTAVSSQFIFISDLAKMVKEVHECVTVCGGVHTTIFPECLFRAPSLDGIFRGECESSFLDFVSAVSSGRDHRRVDNFCYIENGRLVQNRLRERTTQLETLPFPDRQIYDYQSVIDENNGMTTIMTSRGCPFQCTYCSNAAIARVYGVQNNAIRYNSIEKSIAEIEMLKSRYQFARLYFIDDLFILNGPWLMRFLSEYKRRFSIPFICHIRPNVCTRETLFALKDAGCYRIFLAVESANDHIRNKVMKRNITIEQLENIFRWAKEAGVETLSINIIGVPGETEASIWDTINFNKRMNPTSVGVNIFNPYEGTELGDYCRNNNLIDNIDSRSFFDRKESRLKLATISSGRLIKLRNDFSYLIYKDVDPIKARQALWVRRQERLERLAVVGAIVKIVKKSAAFKSFKNNIKKIMLATT